MNFPQYPSTQKQFHSQQQRYDDSSFYENVQKSYPSATSYKTNTQSSQMDEHSWDAENKNKINRTGNSHSNRTSESDSATGWYAPSSTILQNNHNSRRSYNNNWQPQPLSSYPPSILTLDTGMPLMSDIYEGQTGIHQQNSNNRNRYQNQFPNNYNGPQQTAYRSRNGSLSYEEQSQRGSIKTGGRRFLNNELSSASENDSNVLPNNKYSDLTQQSIGNENLTSNNINEQRHSVN